MKLEKNYKYKFSIVMAIYNVEKYLEEAILSVINQDIGFEKYVQLILVNDGSPDNSNKICEKYKQMYPNNIVYIEKENGGVSSARNEGMKYIEGKYMNFLDSDDKLELNALSKVYDFFEEVYKYTDVVSIPVYFFEAKEGNHLLNYKYKKTRQINLLKEYKNIQMFVNSVFIKSEFKDEFKFNTNMKYAEDAELVNRILLNKETMGVVNKTNYWYRFRYDASSAVQVGNQRKEWYIDNLKNFSLGLIKYCIENRGYVPKFIQYLVMYDLQWRFRLNKINESVLNDSEKEEFMSLIKEVLRYIDDKIILEQGSITTAHKLYILKLKNGKSFNLKLISSPNNIEIMLNENYVDSICNENIRVDLIDVKHGYLCIEGAIGKIIPEERCEIVVYINDKEFLTETIDRSINNEKSLDVVIKEIQGFKCRIPIDLNSKEQIVKIYLKIKDSLIRTNLTLGKFVMINKDLSNSYFSTETHRVVFKYNSFILLKNSLKVNFGREYRLLTELLKKKQRKVVCIRMLYFLSKLINKKKIWLFMDRTDKADDNAEHLYKYSLKQNDNVKKYFVVKKDSPDFERIKSYGNVVAYQSMYHKWLILNSDMIISSHIEDSIRVPFRGNGTYLRELLKYKFVFLQHGIIMNNLSTWLNKYNKNIDLFVTTVNKEYESILTEDYGYDENVVKLTGLPRYDNLENKIKKQILIMPTWRSNTVNEFDQTKGIRTYNEKFKESEYFKTYNRLINNSDLIDMCKKYGYKVIFCPHPAIHQQIEDFTKNDYVEICKYNESYQKLFNESSILITDYSSINFDFAYLKKPILYYQFDRETFYSGQIYTSGYFDYDTMAFGDICFDEKDLLLKISDLINNNAEMSDKYKSRVDSFYRYTDKSNCKRVYDEIVRLERERK